jgi:hypothetical protein
MLKSSNEVDFIKNMDTEKQNMVVFDDKSELPFSENFENIITNVNDITSISLKDVTTFDLLQIDQSIGGQVSPLAINLNKHSTDRYIVKDS